MTAPRRPPRIVPVTRVVVVRDNAWPAPFGLGIWFAYVLLILAITVAFVVATGSYGTAVGVWLAFLSALAAGLDLARNRT